MQEKEKRVYFPPQVDVVSIRANDILLDSGWSDIWVSGVRNPATGRLFSDGDDESQG